MTPDPNACHVVNTSATTRATSSTTFTPTHAGTVRLLLHQLQPAPIPFAEDFAGSSSCTLHVVGDPTDAGTPDAGTSDAGSSGGERKTIALDIKGSGIDVGQTKSIQGVIVSVGDIPGDAAHCQSSGAGFFIDCLVTLDLTGLTSSEYGMRVDGDLFGPATIELDDGATTLATTQSSGGKSVQVEAPDTGPKATRATVKDYEGRVDTVTFY